MSDWHYETRGGLSLRDLIALEAFKLYRTDNIWGDHDKIANWAYADADAMLCARAEVGDEANPASTGRDSIPATTTSDT